ncbi:MAG: 3-dehydroquinate synthase [Opitutales bacterium]|nr:3-dehydroquinate synthase [Opitutales bacterium]
MKTSIVRVELSGRSYDIYIAGGASILAAAAFKERLSQKNPLAFVSEENVWGKYASFDSPEFASCPKIIVENGEGAKRIGNFERVCRGLAEAKIDRSGAIAAVGGGVVGDLAGFCAASYMRGIDFYQVPTTLLAMVDSSVGGKTAVNIPEGKNLVGAFYQPKAVFIDTNFLKTLPPREFSAGMAEVIKYGLLGDKSFFEAIENLSEPLSHSHPEMGNVVARCCKMKAKIVSEDERETAKDGGRALLNLGHTFAHAIENVAGYGNYLHGEAVGLGILLAARLSARLGMLGEGDVERIKNVMQVYGIPVKFREPISVDDLIEAGRRDKKAMSGKSRYVLLNGIGCGVVVGGIDELLAREIFETAMH